MCKTIYYLPKNSLKLKHNCYLFMFIDKTNKSTFCTPSSLICMITFNSCFSAFHKNMKCYLCNAGDKFV